MIPARQSLCEGQQRQTFLRVKTLVLATFLGLLWFPLIYISSDIGHFLSYYFFHYQGTSSLHTLDNIYMLCFYLTMIVISAIVYLGVVPYCSGFRYKNYQEFLGRIGITGYSRRGGAIAGIIIAIALFILLLTSLAPYALVWKYNWMHWIIHLQPPLVEEVVFRGIILFVLSRHFPAWFAIVWSALLFGVLHFAFGFSGVFSAILLAGIPWAFIRLRTGSIWPTALVHYGGNSGFGLLSFIAMIVMFAILLVDSIIKHWPVSPRKHAIPSSRIFNEEREANNIPLTNECEEALTDDT